MQLHPFHRAEREAAEAEQRKLHTAPAYRAAEHMAAGDEILADGRRWQVELQFRDLATDMGDKAVGIRAGPDLVLIFMWITFNRRLDPRDQGFRRRALYLGQYLGLVAEPVIVRRASALHQRIAAVPRPPADDLIAIIIRGVPRFMEIQL